MSIAARSYLYLTIAGVLVFGSFAGADSKDGTVQDLEAIPNGQNLAVDAFGEAPVSLDATDLSATGYRSQASRVIELEPEGRYTLGVVYRATGSSIITAGVKWQMPEQPAGLVDVEDHRVRWPASEEWVLRAFTFRADHEYTNARIILKAYGGMDLQVRDVMLVEGWYAD
ncbi:MAG: hypothetical protein ACQER1_10740 [Armatimonadota bacterium]